MKNLYFKIFNKPNTFIDQLLKFNTTKLLTLIITVTCTIATSFGQGSESFDNLNASASGYGSGSYSGDAGVTWSYNGARLVTSTYNITGTTIGFGSSGTRNVSALSGSGGVGEVFYTVSRYFTGGTASDRSIEVYINGTLYDSFTLLAEGPVYPRSFIANESGDVTIEFRSVGSRQIVIDDVSWTAFSGGSCPTITVDTTPYNLDCFGYDFQVTINPNGGTAPYTITATGGTPDGMNPNIFYFDGFQTPTYTTTITVVDANGCESGDIDLELTNPELVVTGSAVSTPESCLGASDGTITYSGQSGGTPHVGNPSYPDGWSYYLIGNGLNISQSSSTFTNLAPGNYSVGASDAYGCGTGLFGIEVTTNDITPPNAIAQNVTVTLDAAGNGTLTAAEVDNGSNDNCSAVSLSIDNTTFSCADISSATTTNDLFISEYIEGGSNNKCIEIYNGTGAAIDLGIEGYAIGRYSNGASSPFTIGLSGVLADGDVYVVCHSSSIGAFLTEADLTDSNLNFNGDDAVALLKSGTPIDIFGTIGEDPGSYWSSTSNRTQNRTLVRNSDVSAGVTTNGSNFPTLETEWTEFPQDTSSELGSHTLAGGSGPIVTLTATDTNGNTATATANVTVVDDIAPNAICQAVTIQLDASGSATLDPADVDNGSNDTCGIASVVLSQTDFDCSHIGTNTVTLTVTDISGNVSSCDATITVEDNEAPIAIAQNVTVTLDATGNGTISAAEVDNGSNDNCGAVTLSIDNSNFTCADIVAADSASDLFISEYIEGGSNNKCIEIYNGTGAPIDLAVGNYTLERYSNGSGFGTSIALSGTIADGDVHVICNPSSIAAFLSESDETNSNINFNGDDAVALLNDGVTIDIFGKIGQDPGSQWSQGGNATANRTLVRNSNILTGNTDDITDFPSLATEWTEFPQDTSSELGNHTVASGSGPTVTLTVTDANNNSSTATANVIVIDDTAPIAICQNVTLQLDASGVATLTTDQVDNGSNDACGIDSLALSQTNFDCSHIGTNSVTLTVTDVNGNSSTCTATITVEDNESPTIVCNTITVQLNNTGDYTLTQSDINAIGAGSYDACSAVTFSVDIDSFDCNNVIANAVVIPDLIITEYVEGSSSNKYIEIYNGTGGIVDLSDYELRLYSNGNSSPSTTNTLSGTLSNGSTIVYSNSSAAIYGGASTVLSAVNWNGDDAIELWKISTNAAVDIFGKIGEDPGSQWGSTAINETQNQTLRRNSDVLQGNTDDLSGFPALQTEWTELPIDDVSGLGSHSIDSGNTDATEVILTATDANGNTANCTATIIVEDNIAPTAICQNVTVQLDANGNGTLTPEEVDNGSNDTCGILSLELNQTDFDCSHIGLTNEVTLTVTDVNGNSSTCTANVTVVDSVSPNAIGQNITVELDASGNATITAADIDNGSNDACGIESLSIDVNSFDCSNIATNPGEVSDLFISEYAEGSSSNKYIEIYNGTGSDVDLSDYELRLYSNGNSSPSTTNTLSGTLSNGSTIVYRNNNANIYSGPATVLSAVNWNGDDAIELWKISANAAVDIFGHIGEDPGSQWTQGGNNTANQTLVRNQAVTSGNTDNLPGFPSLGTEWTELAQDDVSGLGNHSAGLGNNVVLTVTDSNGNTSTAMVAVTVEDNQTPTITCPEDIEVDTDLGECGAVVEFTIDADDNCSNTTITQTEGLPSGTMFPVGTTTNTFVVTDAGGNTATCSFDVTVDDNEAPNVNCAAITVVLDGNGEVNVTASQLDDNSSDNCGIASYTIDGNSSADFTCADTGGDLSDLIISQYIDGPDANDCIEIYNGTGNTVELTGNYSISIYFNGITTPQVWPLLGSIANDDTYVICQQFSDAEATGNVDLINGIMWNGNDAVSLDNNGNAIDILGIIGNNPGLDWNAGGNSTKNTSLTRNIDVLAGNIGNDNSGLASEWSQTAWSDMSGLGNHDIEIVELANNVILTITDIHGNSSTCVAAVTVVDDTPPLAVAQDVVVELDANGNGSTSAVLVNNGSSDVCGIASLALDQTDFTCADVGNANPVVLTVTDVNGNEATATANVTVVDNYAPTAIAQDVTVVLDAAGNGSITAAEVNNGSSDACGVDTITVSPNTFDCSNVGLANVVTLVVTDINGNVSTATANVVVQDFTAPTAVCQNITLTLDGNGTAAITAADIDGGSSDSCGIALMEVDMENFDCSHLGDNTVTLTVTDNHGNQSTCTATVTVEGTIIDDLEISSSELPELCQGAVMTLTASSTNGVTYQWTTGESGESIDIAANGTYGVTATSASNCTSYAEITISDFDAGSLASAYTILATNSVHLHGANLVQSGGVGVTGNNDRIKVHRSTNIVDFAQADHVQIDWTSNVGTVIPDPATADVPEFLYNNESSNSSTDYTVPRNGTRTVSGTVYDRVRVRRNGTITFTASNIYIRDLDLEDGATVKFAGCANVFIQRNLIINRDNEFNPGGNMVTVYVDANVTVREGSTVNARIHANDHKIEARGERAWQWWWWSYPGNPTYMNGQFIARDVNGFENVIWNADSICEPCPVDPNNDHTEPGNNHNDDDDDGHWWHHDDDDGHWWHRGEGFDVKAWPNPSNTTFNVQVATQNTEDKITIYVFDMNNKLVHQTEFGAEDKYNFGQDLEGGVYIVKVVQGKDMKHVRLVKY